MSIENFVGEELHIKFVICRTGRSQWSGHYICHIFKNDKWYKVNDDKVSENAEPDKKLITAIVY